MEDLEGFNIPAHRMMEFLGGEVVSRKEYDRRACHQEEERNRRLFRRLYPERKPAKDPAWHSPGVNVHNRRMRAAKEKAITRIACYMAKAIRRGWKKNPPGVETLYKQACAGVLGRENPAQSPRKRRDWQRRVLAKLRAFVGAGWETPPPVAQVYDRLPSTTQTLKRSTGGKRPAVLPWEGQTKRQVSRFADSAPPAPPAGGLVSQWLTSPPGSRLRADGVPAVFIGLMRSKLHLFRASHWPQCRVDYSPAHVLSWGARQLRAGKRLDDLVTAYDDAVVRWHGRATDAGCRSSWSPSGMMSDLYGRASWIPTMDLLERVELRRKAAEERERRAFWRRLLGPTPRRKSPAATPDAVPVSAVFDLPTFRDMEAAR